MRINFRNHVGVVVLVWELLRRQSRPPTVIPKRTMRLPGHARSPRVRRVSRYSLTRDRAQSFNQRLALCAIVDNERVVFAMG